MNDLKWFENICLQSYVVFWKENTWREKYLNGIIANYCESKDNFLYNSRLSNAVNNTGFSVFSPEHSLSLTHYSYKKSMKNSMHVTAVLLIVTGYFCKCSVTNSDFFHPFCIELIVAFFSHRDTNTTMKLLTLCALLCAMIAVTTAGGEYCTIISIIYIWV